MREVAIVSYSQTPMTADSLSQNDLELLVPVITDALAQANLKRSDIDFTCSGSCDYLGGAAFAFVAAVDTLGAVPPISESHVEMDAAWALYESWLKIQTGEIDTALIYGFGKSSTCNLPDVLCMQQDPYYLQPLWIDSISTAALQTQQCLDKNILTEQDMAKVVQSSRKNALGDPNTQLKGDYTVDELLAEPYLVGALRKHDCAPITDGASAMVITTKEKASSMCNNPVLIKGINHRIESHYLGSRDLTVSTSTTLAANTAGIKDHNVEFAELHAPFSSQEIILSQSLGLDTSTIINPSGGTLAGNIVMSSGLDRIGKAAMYIMNDHAKTGLAHATSGPCLQHNLVTLLEGQNEK